MKKRISLILFVFLFVFVCVSNGCNYDLIDTNYSYKYVHLYSENKCFEIESWTDYEGEQLQVDIKDHGVILVSSINCILVAEKCPICENHK